MPMRRHCTHQHILSQGSIYLHLRIGGPKTGYDAFSDGMMIDFRSVDNLPQSAHHSGFGELLAVRESFAGPLEILWFALYELRYCELHDGATKQKRQAKSVLKAV